MSLIQKRNICSKNSFGGFPQAQNCMPNVKGNLYICNLQFYVYKRFPTLSEEKSIATLIIEDETR